jgi:putative tryptophan/tyrosine transport system substrate-binding protein
MNRRTFIAGLGSGVVWPLAARSQQAGGIRRIGWMFGGVENDLGSRANRDALRGALAKLGWTEGGNLRIDLRFGAGDSERTRAYATELVGLVPDVMLTNDLATTRAVQQQTQTIPIVFTAGGDFSWAFLGLLRGSDNRSRGLSMRAIMPVATRV